MPFSEKLNGIFVFGVKKLAALGLCRARRFGKPLFGRGLALAPYLGNRVLEFRHIFKAFVD